MYGATYTLTYDIQNRLTCILGGGLSASYTYNADGARIKAVVTTGYVGDYFEISLSQPKASGPGGTLPNCALPRRCVFFPMANNGLILSAGQAWYSYYYAGASRIALRIQSNQLNLNDGVFYFLSDHLGGTSITLNASGVKTAELRYTAWGETRYTSGSTPTQRRYTGQLQAEAGLYFYNARWYDPSLGRFAQADTIVPIATQGTQAWDRYAYANNNSVKNNDPSGHDVGNPGKDGFNYIPDTNGYEPQYQPDLWNDAGDVQYSTNCYAYALNIRIGFPRGKPQPGRFSGASPKEKDGYTVESVYKAAEKDAAATGRSFKPGFPDRKCPENTYKVALIIDPLKEGEKYETDYHWLRLNPDKTWSHKPGNTKVINIDASKKIITNPMESNFKYTPLNYEVFGGFWCVGPAKETSAGDYPLP